MLTIQRDAQLFEDQPHEDTLPQEPEPEKADLNDIIRRISSRVSQKTSMLNIQRKLILEDYMTSRKRPWVRPENKLYIYFVGESAVDDGGPKREFFYR